LRLAIARNSDALYICPTQTVITCTPAWCNATASDTVRPESMLEFPSVITTATRDVTDDVDTQLVKLVAKLPSVADPATDTTRKYTADIWKFL